MFLKGKKVSRHTIKRKAYEKGIEDELNDINKVFRTFKNCIKLKFFGIQFHIERISKQRNS